MKPVDIIEEAIQLLFVGAGFAFAITMIILAALA